MTLIPLVALVYTATIVGRGLLGLAVAATVVGGVLLQGDFGRILDGIASGAIRETQLDAALAAFTSTAQLVVLGGNLPVVLAAAMHGYRESRALAAQQPFVDPAPPASAGEQRP